MMDIMTQFEKGKFEIGDGYVSTPIFVAKENHSTYFDSDINRQVCISLSENVKKKCNI